MNRLSDNQGCHPLPQLHAATGHLSAHMAELGAASTPSEALAAIGALERAAREARDWLAVDLVLDGGWSYTDVARPLGVTRQAASKAYADAVHARLRRTVHGRDEALTIVGCGTAKLDRPAPAGRLYTGSYHQACRRAADAIGGQLIILSARYGLLRPDTWIEPYELRMGQAGAVTVPTLRAQARRLDIDVAGTVTVLAGRDYADAVSAVWPHALRPLDGAHGIGAQMAILTELAHVVTTQVAVEGVSAR